MLKEYELLNTAMQIGAVSESFAHVVLKCRQRLSVSTNEESNMCRQTVARTAENLARVADCCDSGAVLCKITRVIKSAGQSVDSAPIVGDDYGLCHPAYCPRAMVSSASGRPGREKGGLTD